MTQIVLHHYAGSPFSEKVRLVFGMKRVRWRSVVVPLVMPKPDVVALTGGYRRTPFMQIGADIYCDSALICRVVERMVPEPSLFPADSSGLAEIVAQWADSALFWAAVPFTLQSGGGSFVTASAPAEQVQRFGSDRKAMTPNMRRAPPHDAATAFRTYVARLDAMLGDGRPYLLGPLPSIADVAAAQSVWFMRLAPPVADAQLSAWPRVVAWCERVLAFGNGESESMTSAEAIELSARAGSHAPTTVDAGQGLEAGSEVGVSASDYGHDEVIGTLVGLDDGAVVIERRDERAGTVHVHFPRIGFHIRPQHQERAA